MRRAAPLAHMHRILLPRRFGVIGPRAASPGQGNILGHPVELGCVASPLLADGVLAVETSKCFICTSCR